MADNYLERKMEEYRSRGMAPKTVSVRRKGTLTFNFPERRVLVIGENADACRDVVKEFSETGCRVAVIGNAFSCEDFGGARKYNGGETDELSASLKKLLDVWADIDIIVSVGDTVPDVVFDMIAEARLRLPYPGSYRSRLIVIGGNQVSCKVKDSGFIVNRVLADCSGRIRREVVRLCMFMCVPENDFINGAEIIVGG